MRLGHPADIPALIRKATAGDRVAAVAGQDGANVLVAAGLWGRLVTAALTRRDSGHFGHLHGRRGGPN